VRVRESVGVSYQDVLILERWHICNCLTARLGPPVAEVLAKDASTDVTGRSSLPVPGNRLDTTLGKCNGQWAMGNGQWNGQVRRPKTPAVV